MDKAGQIREILQVDEATAHRLAAQCGTVEQAVQRHLEQPEDLPRAFEPEIRARSPRVLPPEPMDPRGHDLEDGLLGSGAVRPAAPSWRRFVGAAFSYVRRCGSILLGIVGRLFTGSPQTDFREEFELAYSTSHPPFFEGNFREALAKSRTQGKVLVVYFHSRPAAGTRSFCADVLPDPDVVAALSQCVFWVADVQHPSHAEMCRSLRVGSYPCVMQLQPRDGQRYDVLGSLQGDVRKDALLAQVEAAQRGRRSTRREQIDTTQLRREQDLEVLESEARDREREREQQRRREEQQAAEAAQAAEQERQASDAQALDARRRSVAGSLPPDEGPVKIQVRFPCGRKLMRRFEADTSVEQVQLWVDCAGVLQPEVSVPDRFELSTAFPTKVLRNPQGTLRDEGLCPSAVLLVRDLDA